MIQSSEGNLKIKTVNGFMPEMDVFKKRLSILKEYFPQMRDTFDSRIINGDKQLPEGISYFPYLTWRQVADTHEEAMIIMIDKLSQSRGGKFQVMFGINFASEYLWKEVASVRDITSVFDNQIESGVKIITSQVDGRYVNISANQMNSLEMKEQFCLDVFSVAIMLLSDPDILASYNDTGIMCSGNRFCSSGKGGDVANNGKVPSGYNKVPCFRVDESGDLVLDLILADKESEYYSSATGFIIS